MDSIEIGSTGMISSRIALGTWAIGGWCGAGRIPAPITGANYGKTVLSLAIRWVLDQGPTIALWGARRPDQLDAVDDVSGWSLDTAALREIDAILARNIADPIAPEFMAPPAAIRDARAVA